jgi:hypothetical protein
MDDLINNALKCHGDLHGRLVVAVAKEASASGCVLCKSVIDTVEAFKPGWTREDERDKKIAFSVADGLWGLMGPGAHSDIFTVHYLPDGE